MLKKMLLSTLLCASAITHPAQINLDLAITITKGDEQRNINDTIVVNEYSATLLELEDDLFATVQTSVNDDDHETVLIDIELLEKTENGEWETIAHPALVAAWNETATVKYGEEHTNGIDNSLTIAVTPTLVE